MKILPVRTCFNCGHAFDSKVDEDTELCPMCLKETDSLFDDDPDYEFEEMHDRVDEALEEMLY